MIRIDDFDNLPQPPESPRDRLRRIAAERQSLTNWLRDQVRQGQTVTGATLDEVHTHVLAPRKSGKSDLAAAMALHLITRKEFEDHLINRKNSVACDHKGIGLPGCATCMAGLQP